MEKRLIAAAVKDRKAYDKLDKLGALELLGPQGKIVWKALDDYYNTDPDCTHADIDIIRERVIRKHERHKDTLDKYISDINNIDVSIANIVKDYIETKKQVLGMQISSKLLNGECANDLMEEYQNVESIFKSGKDLIDQEDEKTIYHLYDIRECINDISRGIRLYPDSLNNVVGGGLQRGHHVVLFARVETGKSLFAINFTYGFCKEGLKCLYISNEDPASSMGERFLSRFTELTRYDMQQLDPDDVMQIAISNGYDNLYFSPMSPGSPKEIRDLIEEYGPFDCLIVDQLRNLKVGGENRVLQLEKSATEIRYIAKDNNLLAVSVTQASGSADNKLVLEMGDIDFSNVGIPAMADVMIGIGMDSNYDSMEQRMVTFCKNKITGEHSSIPVSVNRAISKVEDPT